MRLIEQTKYDYDDVLLMPKRSTLSSRQDVDLHRTMKFKYSTTEFRGIPIMAANMDSVATIEAARVFEQHGLFTCLHKFVSLDEIRNSGLDRGHFAVTIGKDVQALNTLAESYYEDFEYLCIDVANGYSEDFAAFVEKARNILPTKVIIAGNVCTPEMTIELIMRGADMVKVGIGPGSACLARQQTGVGVPQFSAVAECADAAHGVGGRIIGDGGIKSPGDFAKCFGAGGDFAMAGTLFSAHDENSTIGDNGKVQVYGMSSTAAMNKYYGGVNSYRTSEGRVVELAPRGPLANTIGEILGGVRSACTYIGATEIRDMPKCATFNVVNNQLSKKYDSETVGK